MAQHYSFALANNQRFVMSGADIAAWISAVTGIISLIVAVIALRKSSQNASSIRSLEAQFHTVVQSAVHRPMIFGGGGGGGGGGPGGGAGGAGGGVVYHPTQVSNGEGS